jgi:cellulose biosynthesis protein BcsQ
MMLSDLVILPIQQSAWDIWAFNDRFLPKYQDIRAIRPDLDCRILRNATSKTLITREIAKLLENYDIPVLDTVIGRRVAYSTSPLFGKGASEYSDGLARFEIAKLGREITAIINEKVTA